MPKEFIEYLKGKLEHARGYAAVHAYHGDKARMAQAVAVADAVKEILDTAERLAENKP